MRQADLTAIKHQRLKLFSIWLRVLRSQKKHWQKLPYLCARADNLTSSSSALQFCAVTGFWKILEQRLMIDCETGRPVAWNHLGYQFLTRRCDWHVTTLVELHPINSSCDARSIAEGLAAEGSITELPWYIKHHSYEEARAQQDRFIKRYGIEPIFTRKKCDPQYDPKEYKAPEKVARHSDQTNQQVEART